MLRLVVLLCLVLGTTPIVSTNAQPTSVPGAHFGVGLFPDTDFRPNQPNQHTWQYGVEFNLFTELGKELIEATTDFVVYNSIDATYGFNTAFGVRELIWESPLSGSPSLRFRRSVRAGLSIGIIHDKLTSTFQNELIHDVRDIAFVPRGAKVEKNTFFGAGLVESYAALLWSRKFLRLTGLAGAGGTTSTLYTSGYLLGGVELALRIRARRIAAARAYGRLGLIPNALIADRSGFGQGLDNNEAILQLSGVLSLSNIVPGICRFCPALGLIRTWQEGVFVDTQGNAKRERYWSIRLTSPTLHSWFVETWNDIGREEVSEDVYRSKDYGPTFGLRIVRVI